MNGKKYPRINVKDKLLVVTDKHIIKELKMSNFIYYALKKDQPDLIYTIKKGLVAKNILLDYKIPKNVLFKTPMPIKGDNDKMIELYELGLYSECLLKVEVFEALIKMDNKKV